MYCSRRYGFDVFDVHKNNSRLISDTIHSCARSEVTEVQMHEVDLLFECILIFRDGQAALPCWFSRSDVQTIMNYIYMHRVRCFLYVCLFFFSLSLLCSLCIIFVYLDMIYIINNKVTVKQSKCRE